MKKPILLLVLLSLVITTYAAWKTNFNWDTAQVQNADLTKRINRLYLERIGDFQFRAEISLGDLSHYEGFLDSLNHCYDCLRMALDSKEFSAADEDFLSDFLFATLPAKMNAKRKDICQSLAPINCDRLFAGPFCNTLDALLEVLNPNWYCRRHFFLEFDIWENRKIDFAHQDSTILSVRLLKSYNDLMQTRALLAAENFTLLSPYLGELVIYKSELDTINSRAYVEFPTYDWLARDTFIQEVIFTYE